MSPASLASSRVGSWRPSLPDRGLDVPNRPSQKNKVVTGTNVSQTETGRADHRKPVQETMLESKASSTNNLAQRSVIQRLKTGYTTLKHVANNDIFQRVAENRQAGCFLLVLVLYFVLLYLLYWKKSCKFIWFFFFLCKIISSRQEYIVHYLNFVKSRNSLPRHAGGN